MGSFLDCGLLGCDTGCTRQLIWSVEGECSRRLQLAGCVEDGNKLFLRGIYLTTQSLNSKGPVGNINLLKYLSTETNERITVREWNKVIILLQFNYVFNYYLEGKDTRLYDILL